MAIIPRYPSPTASRMGNMKMHVSPSSQIKSFGYDEVAEILHVKFRQGGMYKYTEFSKDKFAELQASDSHGAFLHKRIKPYHHCEKVV